MYTRPLKIVLFLIALLAGIAPALAAKDFNIKNNSQSFFYVNGTSGNIGIGSVNAGQLLDVQGTVRQTGFVLTGNGAASGNVLVTNGVGLGTWMASSTLPGGGASTNYWINDTGNVGINTTYNIGVGTLAAVNSLNILGNIGVGTISYSHYLTLAAPKGGAIFEGNVGIGTWLPNSALVVQGNVGFGTTVPQGALDVTTVSDTTDTDLLVKSGATAGSTARSVVQLREQGGSNYQDGVDLAYDGGPNLLNIQTVNGGTVATVLTVVRTTGNLGIGTTNPGSILSVLGGASFGSYATLSAPAGGVIASGNIGIGSAVPGHALDVQGTARMTGFTLTGNGAAAGNVLVTNGVGVGTWMSPSSIGASGGPSTNYWINDSGNVGINTTYNIGVGTVAAVNSLNIVGNIGIGTGINSPYLTTTAPSGGMIVQGNVGIGSLTPTQRLAVGGGAIVENQNGAAADTVLIGDPPLGGFPGIWLGANAAAPAYSNYSFLSDGTGGNLFNAASGQLTRFRINNTATLTAGSVGVRIFGADTGNPADAPVYPFQVVTGSTNFVVNSSGNVGIGSTVPGETLDVQGTVRTTGFTMSGQTPVSGYVMTASDSAGDTTWTAAGVAGGWTVSGNNVYETSSGNVGIGTSALQTALAVTNGNVGIGTWTAAGGNLIVKGGGNVGIGSAWPGQLLDVQGTLRDTGEIVNGNIGVGTALPAREVTIANGSTPILEFENTGAGTDDKGWLSFASGNTFFYQLINDSESSGITWEEVSRSGTSVTGISFPNGNVGIGSTVPGQELDVQGTARMTGFTLSSGASNGYILVSNGVGIGTWMSVTTLTSSTAVNSPAQDVAYYSNTVSQLTGANNFVTNGTNVGIGTVGLSQASLQIIGNVGIGTVKNGDKFITTSPPNGGMIIEGNVGIGTYLPSNRFEVGTQDFDVATSGNVGINSINPGQTLDMQGIIRTSLGATFNGNVGIGTTVPTTVLLELNSGAAPWSAAPGTTINFSSTGYGFPSGDGTVNQADKIIFWNRSDAFPGPLKEAIGADIYGLTFQANGNPSAHLGFWTGPGPTGSAPFERMRIDANGNVGIGTTGPQNTFIVASGNVGIGSLLPGQMLDVQGTARDLGQIVNGNVGIGTSFINGVGEGAMSIMNGNVGIGTWVPAFNLDLVNNTERMRVVRRVNTEASGSPVTINTDQTDLYTITALAANITFNAPTGTPNNGDLLEIRILDNGTARTITWTTGAAGDFASTTTSLPATTVISTTLRVLVEWNSASSRWECIGVT